jgi:hypothetical protein
VHLADSLAELGMLLGLGPLAFNEHGLCRLRFDNALTIDLESADDGATLHLCASLGAAPADSETLQTLLHANFLGEGTGGAAFALDAARNELLLHRTLAASQLDVTALAAAVESFVNYYEGWTRKLAESPAGDSAPSAAPANLSPAMRV